MDSVKIFHSFMIFSLLGLSWSFYCPPQKETTQLDQIKALHSAMISCFSEIDETGNTTDLYCPRHFDDVMCWPNTEAGQIAKKLCPSYIHGFNTSGYAVKECLPSGEWSPHPRLNKSYTNFTGCIPSTPMIHEPTRAELIQKHMKHIQVLYRVGYALSLTFLLIAVTIMTMFSKLRCQRNTIHINLFLSFILRCIICFIKDEHGIPEGETNVMEDVMRQLTSSSQSWRCKLVHTLFFYILVVNYMWIFAEGIYLHTLIFVTTFHNISKNKFRTLIVVAWVSPVFCIVPWIIVRKTYEDTLCWNLHDPEFGFHWIIEGPIIGTLIINFIFFLNIIRVLFTKLSATNSRDPKCYRKLAKSTLVLIPLFGVHYIVFMALPICLEPRVEIIWMYTELFFSSFQGVAVSILFCFSNGEVKTELRKYWRIRTLRRQSMTSSRSTRTFSLQSSISARELQESPNSIVKRENSVGYVRPTDSFCSIGKESVINENGVLDPVHKEVEADKNPEAEYLLKCKDDNENVPIISSQKVTFF